jgi:hypothetical protein
MATSLVNVCSDVNEKPMIPDQLQSRLPAGALPVTFHGAAGGHLLAQVLWK